MTVDLLGVPTLGIEALGHILGERDVRRPVDRDVVVVVEVHQATEPESPGQGSGLGTDAFHQVPVGAEAEGAMIDELLAESCPEMHLGDRHADTGGETLTEGAGRHLDPQTVVDLGVPRGVTAPLTEAPKVVETQREPTEVEHRVEQHRAMTVGENEAVTVRPVGAVGVHLEESAPQRDRDVGHAHRHTGVTTVRLLHRVHGQCLDRVDR